METYKTAIDEIADKGYTIMNAIFTETEITALIQAISISEANGTGSSSGTTTNLFSIRHFFKQVPAAAAIIFTEKFNSLTASIFGGTYFVVKAIYFDKPPASNWFVAYHQDLTIAVNKKMELPGFSNWTMKQHQFAVQPPQFYLEDNFTIRIHLDDTSAANGALRIISSSHKTGIRRAESIDWENEIEETCNVKKGGIMIMKPLLLHSSGRTTNNERRRVIHIEFSRQPLPGGLQWTESFLFP